jgi:hypothetical protein
MWSGVLLGGIQLRLFRGRTIRKSGSEGCGGGDWKQERKIPISILHVPALPVEGNR